MAPIGFMGFIPIIRLRETEALIWVFVVVSVLPLANAPTIQQEPTDFNEPIDDSDEANG